MEKLVPNPFLKNWNWAYLWINSLKFYEVYFHCMTRWGLSKYIETKLQTICFHLILSYFQKIKRGLELVSLPHFPHNFSRKKNCYFLFLYSIGKISCYILLTDQISLYKMCIAIVCKPGCVVMDFEVNFIFLIKPFYLHDQKVLTKT